MRIDLNADLGESFSAWTLGDDDALLEPTLPGALQVPPDGRSHPALPGRLGPDALARTPWPGRLGPDAPVTGGYPVIAVVRGSDLDAAAQLGPGAQVRFTTRPVT